MYKKFISYKTSFLTKKLKTLVLSEILLKNFIVLNSILLHFLNKWTMTFFNTMKYNNAVQFSLQTEQILSENSVFEMVIAVSPYKNCQLNNACNDEGIHYFSVPFNFWNYCISFLSLYYIYLYYCIDFSNTYCITEEIFNFFRSKFLSVHEQGINRTACSLITILGMKIFD